MGACGWIQSKFASATGARIIRLGAQAVTSQQRTGAGVDVYHPSPKFPIGLKPTVPFAANYTTTGPLGGGRASPRNLTSGVGPMEPMRKHACREPCRDLDTFVGPHLAWPQPRNPCNDQLQTGTPEVVTFPRGSWIKSTFTSTTGARGCTCPSRTAWCCNQSKAYQAPNS